MKVSSDSQTQLSNSHIKSFLASIPVEHLDLSIRSKNALIRAKVLTALEVQRLIETNALADVYSIGPLAAGEIEECMKSLFETQGSGKLSGQARLFNDVKSAEFIIPDNYLDNLPIDILDEELGGDLLARLKLAHIEKFGELANLSRTVSGFIQNAASSLNRLIKHQKEILQTKIEKGQLHPQAQYRGRSIQAWLNTSPKSPDEQFKLLKLLSQANETASLTDELSSLFARVSDRDFQIYINYFEGTSTLEKIGKQMEITRERVRQITSKVATKLWDRVNQNPSLYLQSAILLAQDLGDQLSLQLWEQQLQQRNLINSKIIRQSITSFDLLCRLLRSGSKANNPPKIEMGEGLSLILNSPSNLSLSLIKNIEAMPRKAKREIQRRISLVGGVHLTEASEILDVVPQEAADILKYLGFKEVMLDWYTIASGDFTTRWPILKAGFAMMEACGPLEFDLFCDGLRRYISRFYEVLAPPAVIKAHLETLGFELEEDFVCWPETPTGYLADSDKCFIEAVNKYGPIVTFLEVLDTFQDNGFSMPSATSRVLPQSPIVEKVEFGLYKLRGQSHTWEDIESAKSRQETIDYAPEVTYGRDGIIRYRITIGSWALNGVISISASQQPLPDLGDGWNVVVDNKSCGTAKRDDYLVWGLGGAFSTLAVQIGDRVELAFDAWEEPFIRISKI